MESPPKELAAPCKALASTPRNAIEDEPLKNTNGRHPGGRPTKRTAKMTEQICDGISNGLTDEEVAALVGIDDSTLTRWKKEPEFCGAIKKAVAMRLLIRLKRTEKGESGWQGTAWAMERQNPERFGSPEARLRRRDAVNEDETVRKVMRWMVSQEDNIRELVGGNHRGT
jgi:hypothetical protein